MKKLLLLFVSALLLNSCAAVKFEDPQPANAPAVTGFPEKMQGIYTSADNDTLSIFRNSFRYFNGKEVNVTASLDTTDAVVLKRLKNNYILNLKDEQGWDVVPIKFSRNRITARYANLNSRTEPLIKKLEENSPVRKITTEDGKFSHYLIAPTDKEFKTLLRKKLFSEKTTFRRIRRH